MGRALAVVAGTATTVIALVCATVCSSARTAVAEGVDLKQSPAPPKSIAGMRGFESVSSLVYDEGNQTPHKLVATYMFPDRARWFLSAGDEKALERQMRYRSGTRVFSIDGRSSASRDLDGAERIATLRQLELRRATMLWPDGFEWKVNGAEARADAGDVGTLVAQLDKPSISSDNEPVATRQPTRVTSLDREGVECESFRNLTWRDVRGRKWPGSAELWYAGKRVWREQFDTLETSVRFVDSYFLPPDRREQTSTAPPKSGQIQHLDLPATVSLRVALKASDWESALTECARLRDEWTSKLAKQGLELESKWTIEISAQGTPAACIVRMTGSVTSPPAEFESTGPRSGVGVLVDGFAEITPARWNALDAAKPKTSRALPAYVRFERDQARTGPILIVLPLGVDR